MAENIANCLMLPAILPGNIVGKYFQQYAILMAHLNVPLQLTQKHIHTYTHTHHSIIHMYLIILLLTLQPSISFGLLQHIISGFSIFNELAPISAVSLNHLSLHLSIYCLVIL